MVYYNWRLLFVLAFIKCMENLTCRVLELKDDLFLGFAVRQCGQWHLRLL